MTDTHCNISSLGVTIDNRLSWIPHINDIYKKLKSATGMLYRMRDNIPREHYKPLYYALFESHVTYCITVLGTVSKTCSEKLGGGGGGGVAQLLSVALS